MREKVAKESYDPLAGDRAGIPHMSEVRPQKGGLTMENREVLLQCINVMHDSFAAICRVRDREAEVFYNAYYRAYEELLHGKTGKQLWNRVVEVNTPAKEEEKK